jgi:RecA/RadA recombinase
MLRNRVCAYCTPQPFSALELLHKPHPSPLSTGMANLDGCLKGGFRLQTISEIVGSAGAGKTQFAMQLCVEAAKRGFGTVYIDTEKKLNLERLREIATFQCATDEPSSGGSNVFYKSSNPGKHHGGENDCKHPDHVLNNITVHTPSSTKELLSLIQSLEEEIVCRNEEALSHELKFPVHLVIIDSIAAPSQRDFGDFGSSAPQRSALLMEIAANLKRLVDQLQLYGIVVNQVASSNLTTVRAALGNSWHHCLSTRILMEHHERSDPVRRATLVKSNVAGNGTICYQVTVKGLEETALNETMRYKDRYFVR